MTGPLQWERHWLMRWVITWAWTTMTRVPVLVLGTAALWLQHSGRKSVNERVFMQRLWLGGRPGCPLIRRSAVQSLVCFCGFVEGLNEVKAENLKKCVSKNVSLVLTRKVYCLCP